MGKKVGGMAEAERLLRQALQILAHPGSGYQPEEWCLLATLVGDADLMVREERRGNPTLRMPLLDQTVNELRDATAGFKDSSFLSATAAARRRNPTLFAGRA